MKTNLLKKMALAAIVGVVGFANAQAQDGGYVFTQPENGVVVIEGEHYYSVSKNTASSNWETATTFDGFVGDGYIAAPALEDKYDDTDNPKEDGPFVTYRVNFIYEGTHYLICRCSFPDDGSDSFWLTLDDEGGFSRLNPWTEFEGDVDVWGWAGTLASGEKASVVIAEGATGEHDIKIYMREPKF